MKEGDVILKIDGKAITDRMGLFRGLSEGPAKKVVTVRRDGKEVDLNLNFEPPAEPAKTNP